MPLFSSLSFQSKVFLSFQSKVNYFILLSSVLQSFTYSPIMIFLLCFITAGFSRCLGHSLFWFLSPIGWFWFLRYVNFSEHCLSRWLHTVYLFSDTSYFQSLVFFFFPAQSLDWRSSWFCFEPIFQYILALYQLLIQMQRHSLCCLTINISIPDCPPGFQMKSPTW